MDHMENVFESALRRYLSDPQLNTIRNARIGIGGAGGLGSNVAIALIRTGFRHLEIIDKDIVEASNLNRQDYTIADIGKPKVECLKARILSINPDADITIHRSEWTPVNAEHFFKDATIIIEAFDKAATKTHFVEYYAPRVSFIISGNGMAGIMPNTSATTVRKTGNIFLIGDGITSIEDNHPPLAPRVLQCAAKIAEVTLNLLNLPNLRG
jgi:sulfur carrier protein ThiS adenylyltransferase